ncbi:UDP-N-acetylmuramoyl-L-alanine--D-glutamate ligase [Fibrella forsythiae]|uniref:UDP-N-acetylmuramoylalanine--D-glutamate ligase n=1 Tax=Fibrella forsythiae TaxID=2817061 RepID=A0ABS3JKE9_9BACT|nr:UDP-N-acetylmuramoyl-L-alanine--D-glutamate ligase [Fibrella forsythiae]MBO0950472.1 UDP-N-acetylmuramoyl-L-alanine--D-glutamate ligase [Fibrella forsythiae]
MRLVILGGGESGVGAALLGQAKGYDVFLSDRSPIKATYLETLREAGIPFEEGQHTERLILNATEVVKSPGIPDTVPLVVQLKAMGIPVISEIEFAARYTQAKLIGITGSNGKTTTTLLTYHLLKTAGLNVGLAGNIGDSFAKQVINDTFDYFVLELSSFQLDSMYATRLDTAILLNITPDHLDRYAYKFQNYVDSKFRVLQNLTPADTFIYFQENAPTVQEIAARKPDVYTVPISLETATSPGGYAHNGQLTTRYRDRSFTIDTASLPLQGPHNALNMLAAILAAQSVNVPDEAISEGLRTFRNAAHRMEPAGVINGIKFINDSKATNVDSVFYALSSMHAPTIWIAGGQDKGNDYSQLDEVVGQRVKALICLGKDNKKLVDYFNDKVDTIRETQDVTEAIQLALELGQPGDMAILSPACASFDLFKNYEDRGNQFKAAVQALLTNK